MPLPNNSFDAVICTDVLEHVLNPWGAVLEIGRLLKSHGCSLDILAPPRLGGMAFLQVPFGGAAHELS